MKNRQKRLYNDRYSIKSDKAGAKDAKIDCYIVGKGYSIGNLFDIIRKTQELKSKDKETEE